ncbi:ABC transporter permease [Paeniglutamicibacter terrestris]|uniref:ABC transporter permease n=1 Tax=Paeniglutamicibacter terrestris TaxID=2723403 RepID=A0ABX1G2J2_9MICC|nr:ABC transporter permease [Paeniglutamicibacter terrestris]NKG19826.1 ABC transporter permease [Paeniglutamicibacter terrestris]
MSMFLEAFTWLADSAAWMGATSIGHRLGQHLIITMIVVGIAAAIALPVGIAIGHTGRGRGFVIAAAGAARAVPTLGLLTILALAMGIGITAPIVALIVLAVPPLLAGTYAGIENVERTTIDAARAAGMNEFQIIVHVELPLAAHVILGGFRSATLQVIATATLAAYVSDSGLGRYIFAGLKSRDYPQMLAGALLVAALAILIDLGLSVLQRMVRRSVEPRMPRPRSRVAGPSLKGAS